MEEKTLSLFLMWIQKKPILYTQFTYYKYIQVSPWNYSKNAWTTYILSPPVLIGKDHLLCFLCFFHIYECKNKHSSEAEKNRCCCFQHMQYLPEFKYFCYMYKEVRVNMFGVRKEDKLVFFPLSSLFPLPPSLPTHTDPLPAMVCLSKTHMLKS